MKKLASEEVNKVPKLERLELCCSLCGNDTEFRERTVSKWLVGSDGEREEKISEVTEYFCICGEKVKTIDEVGY